MTHYSCDEVLDYIEGIARTRESDVPLLADLRAEQMYRGAIADFPEDWRPARILAERMIRRGRYEAALEVTRDRYRAHPEDARALRLLVILLLTVGQFDEVNKVYAQAPEAQQAILLGEKMVGRYVDAMMVQDSLLDPSLDFPDLFFVRELVGKVAGIKQAAAAMGNRYFLQFIDYAKRYVESQGGTFLYCTADNLFAVENKSALEIAHLDHGAWLGDGDARSKWLATLPPHVEAQYAHIPGYSSDYMRQVTTGGKHIVQATRIVMADYTSDYVNVRNNLRVTTDAPEKFSRRVLILGASEAYGSGVEDAHTFASHMQRALNAARPNTFRVENHGTGGHPVPMCLLNLIQTRVNPGDVVIMYGYPPLIELPEDLTDLKTHHVSFARPHDHGEVFVDHFHAGPKGHEVIGSELTELVLAAASDGVAKEIEMPPIAQAVAFLKYLVYRQSADVAESGRLKEYISFLSASKSPVQGKIGSVAVNCNPMTKGHLHLLEYAAAHVDFLYVFVIEEDQSFFSFADRLRVVTEGLAHLDNVMVLRGGQYICTQLTFPEYFSKDDVQEVAADASMEAWFFSEYIAKALDISIIFLGNEPNCEITSQYNDKMSAILPEYGITVDIIPRISANGAVISASHVRRLLKTGDFDGIREIVPPATYNYLIETYGDGVIAAE